MDRKTLEQKLWRYRSDQARAEYLRRYIPLMEKRLAELKEEALQGIGKALPPDAVRMASGLGDPTALLGMRAAENALTDCLLSSLTDESRYLLTERYIKHLSWPELARRYAKHYHVDYTPLTLRRRSAQALDALCGTCEMAG